MNAIVEEITPEVAELLKSDDSINPEDALNHAVTLTSKQGRKLARHSSSVDLEMMIASKELLMQNASPQLQRWQLLTALLIFDFSGKGEMIIPSIASFFGVSNESARFVVERTIAKIAEIEPAAVKNPVNHRTYPLGSALIH